MWRTRRDLDPLGFKTIIFLGIFSSNLDAHTKVPTHTQNKTHVREKNPLKPSFIAIFTIVVMLYRIAIFLP